MKENAIFILNYLLEILKIILSSWQICILIVAVMFKKDITNFVSILSTKIGNINKFKLGDVELETIEKVIEEYPTESENINDDYPLEMQFLSTWILFEKTLNIVLKSEASNNHNIRNLINVAFKHKMITSQEKKVLKDILRYRNFIVHCENVIIINEELDNFIDFLNSMIVKIEKFKENKGE